MTDFNPLEFIAGHAGMCYADAIKEAYEQGKRDAQPEPAIPLSWIPSSEKLPELSERVLVTDGVQISMSRLGSGYNGSYIWMFDTFWNDLEDLPYWMPLPALPLKESD